MDIDHLVRAARTGDKEAFGKLYDTFLDAVYRFVFFRVETRETAEDITESVFVSAFEHIGNYKEQGLPFAAWLYQIARNKVTDHYRSHKSTVPVDAVAETLASRENVEHSVEVALTHEYIMKCLRLLPDTYQEVIILKYIEEKTNEELSELLDKPLAHVRVLQSRAMKKLKEVAIHE